HVWCGVGCRVGCGAASRPDGKGMAPCGGILRHRRHRKESLMTRNTIVPALMLAALGAVAALPVGAFPASAEAHQIVAPQPIEDVAVTVLVVDVFTGRPMAGWDVLIGPKGPHDFWFTGTTGNMGTARFLLPPGDYRAWASRGGPGVWGTSFSAGEDETCVVVFVNPCEN